MIDEIGGPLLVAGSVLIVTVVSSGSLATELTGREMRLGPVALEPWHSTGIQRIAGLLVTAMFLLGTLFFTYAFALTTVGLYPAEPLASHQIVYGIAVGVNIGWFAWLARWVWRGAGAR
jgi:hypothetical protein